MVSVTVPILVLQLSLAFLAGLLVGIERQIQ